ncbi:MAG TPA: hypothetical protein PL033_07245 [Candidatus Brocadiia bacterium]|nr:hypothetical protein [Candidatus Brocadiia bacterium]
MQKNVPALGLAVIACVVLAAATAAGAERKTKPVNMLGNGGLDSRSIWTFTNDCRIVPDGAHDACLECAGQSSVMQDIPCPAPGRYSISCRIKVDEFAASEPGGHVYAAVYQLDADGKILSFKDFVYLQGVTPWLRHAYDFEAAPGAHTFSIRAGIFLGRGRARFDDFTLVAGGKAMDIGDVEMKRETAVKSGPARVAILKDDFPVCGAPSSPDRIAEILRKAGMEAELVDSAALADPAKLDPRNLDLVVLPYGEAFPAEARDSFLGYLRKGGRFLSLGGYAFQKPLFKVAGARVAIEDVPNDHPAAYRPNLIANSGFEDGDKGWDRVAPEMASVVEDSPRSGQKCARVCVPQGGSLAHSMFRADIKPIAGHAYTAEGWMKTREIQGFYAYMAVYQYDASDKLVEFQDFVQTRGTRDWRRYAYTFTANQMAARIQFQLGIYQATGEAWFDDAKLLDVTAVGNLRINTSEGAPKDGLEVRPDQIGVFDPSFPLKRVSRLVASPDQSIAPGDFELPLAATGWAATAVRGFHAAKYVPILDAVDRFGRSRGPAAAIIHHQEGAFAGSSWGFVGVDNADLFSGDPKCDALLVGMARRLVEAVYIESIETDKALYSPGEKARVVVTIRNMGIRKFEGEVALEGFSDNAERYGSAGPLQVKLNPGESKSLTIPDFPIAGDGLAKIRCALSYGGKTVDEEITGFVAKNESAVKSGPQLSFSDNYFRLDGRPVFMTGSDTFNNVFNTRCHNPATWDRDLRMAKDIGLSVYENLQYTPPNFEFSEKQFNQFDAMLQLVSQNGLIYMPCLLCGHNVAIDDATLAKQKEMCRKYAGRYKDAARLILYLNGDLRYDIPQEQEWYLEKWRAFLKNRYGSDENLRTAWGEKAQKTISDAAMPAMPGTEWTDRSVVDRTDFELSLTRLWLNSMKASCREAGAKQPTTAEFYCIPFGGIDAVASIGDTDVANIGYFKLPYEDIRMLPPTLRWTDQRARGKSLTLGEFGVKTHPAWGEENGAFAYHIGRTEQEAIEHFLAVGYYSFGMGASKIQNWCLDDAQEWIFPWGLFYPGMTAPKDTAIAYRNMSLVFRTMSPVYIAPKLTFLIPDNHRFGWGGQQVHDAVMASLLALTNCHADFNTINEYDLAAIPETTKAIWYPVPYCPSDKVVGLLEKFLRRGGSLYISGDISYDENRRRTRAARLESLAGVSVRGENYPNISWRDGAAFPLNAMKGVVAWDFDARPGLKIEAKGAEALTASGETPLLVENRLGKGRTIYVNDPIEMREPAQLGGLYRRILDRMEVVRTPVIPDEDDIHILTQPLENGTCMIAYGRDETRGMKETAFPCNGRRVRMNIKGLTPGLTHVAADGRLLAAQAFGSISVDGRIVKDGEVLCALLSLDESDLVSSKAILLVPFGIGRVWIRNDSIGNMKCSVGDLKDGRWVGLEDVKIQDGAIDIDPDRAASLLLLTTGDEGKWRERVETLMFKTETRP